MGVYGLAVARPPPLRIASASAGKKLQLMTSRTISVTSTDAIVTAAMARVCTRSACCSSANAPKIVSWRAACVRVGKRTTLPMLNYGPGSVQ